ncbi:hypothetical protein AN958_08405, partial [Leucoagaricus sp. SymC.cos]
VLSQSKNFTSSDSIPMPPTIPINHYSDSRNQQNRTARLKFNYELFNCNNFNICYWSWNYCGCWHQTCPPIVPH